MAGTEETERDRIAGWWDARMGDEGDLFYRRWIDPAVMEALGETRGMRVLDLNCGTGVLTRKLARAGAAVTGVDSAAEMIGRARARELLEPLGITYREADPSYLKDLADESFDLAVANMALAGIGGVAAPLREVLRLLRPGGRLVCSLPHPCFDVPEHSAWQIERDTFGERVYRKIGRYLPISIAEMRWAPDQPDPLPVYHRPLSWYLRLMIDTGFVIVGFAEPTPGAELAAAMPDLASWLKVVPLLAVITASKPER